MYNIYLSPIFVRDKDTKEIVKSHFQGSKVHFALSLEQFLQNHNTQSSISLGKNLFKLDFSPDSFKKGKRKSYRLIIAFIEIEKVIIPIKIYKKSRTGNITKKKLSKILDQILLEGYRNI